MGAEAVTFKKGSKISQLILERHIPCQINVIDKFTKSTSRGENGFGSSDRKPTGNFENNKKIIDNANNFNEIKKDDDGDEGNAFLKFVSDISEAHDTDDEYECDFDPKEFWLKKMSNEESSEVHTKFVFFYSSKSIYSNFHPAEFSDPDFMNYLPKCSKFSGKENFKFSQTEQYLHAWKALIFYDIRTLDQILSTPDPNLAKKLGRKVEDFKDDIWILHARKIATRGCCLKFNQNPEMWEEMRVAGMGKHFVECAARDRRWGIGLGMNNPKRLDPAQWQGLNWLGQCLDDTWHYLSKGKMPELFFNPYPISHLPDIF